nr:hypothetical protein [Lachnospiraceae bacterium]
MSEIQIKQGNLIYEKGKSLTMLSIIMEGTVSVELPHGTMTLGSGDVIGLMDLYTMTHSYSYLAESDVVVDSYPYKSLDSLHNIFEGQATLPKQFAASAAKQFFAVADFIHICMYNCDSLYSALMEYHRNYTMLCKQYQMPAKNLPGLEEVQPLVLENQLDEYISSYYKDLQAISSNSMYIPLFARSGFCNGLLYRASQDMHQFMRISDETENYLAQLSQLLINEEKIDFLDLYTSLLSHATHKKEDTLPLVSAIGKMFIRAKDVSSVPEHIYQQRLAEYRRLTQELEAVSASREEDTSEQFKEIQEKLKHSLTVLLDFAQMDHEFRERFIKNMDSYKKTVDKTAVSAELSALRSELTKDFFALYKGVFFAALKEPILSDVVKMFLYFGYVDEDLCGLENAARIYTLLPICHSDPANQIYLFYDWLKLIYEGKKQPRRDEFDQDYPAYVQTQINDGKITKEESISLLNDNTQKVHFELDNMFVTAVKMTYGRLQTYCPILSEHDFIKTPEETLVQPQKLKEAFTAVTTVDFSAYCREVMFSDPCLASGRELVQREIYPDVILLPNLGIRAALWQEIEGRNRSTPGCMLFPVFCLSDVSQLVIRLTGEFRWDMCKRMQGARWNDVSNLSLTSEYFDYLQFYKKNKDLSPDAKEKCRQQLMRVKNRFREAFVLDYMTWIMYEAKGAPHMNKVVRKVFMTYCPFSSAYRESLKKNPFYSAMIEKYENQKAKEITRMNGVIYRIQRTGKKVIPPEIEQQMEYLKK